MNKKRDLMVIFCRKKGEKKDESFFRNVSINKKSRFG